jgi:hypothetical protein
MECLFPLDIVMVLILFIVFNKSINQDAYLVLLLMDHVLDPIKQTFNDKKNYIPKLKDMKNIMI